MDGLDVCMFKRIGDDCHVKARFFDIKDRKADAVEADGALLDHEAAELPGKFEAKFPAAPECLSFGAGGGGIDVSLDDMAVEAAVERHAAFEVHEGARLPGIKVCLPEGLFDGGHAVGIFGDFLCCEADAVMGDTLIDL